MRSGNLRDTIYIEVPREDESLEDDDGVIDYTDDNNWNDWINRRAEVVATSGREFVLGQKVQAETTWMIRLHFDDEVCQVHERMRIRLNGVRLGIVAAYPDGNRQREFIIQAKEAKNG